MAQQAFASGMDLILLVGGLVVLMGVLAAATLVRGRELAPRPEPRRIEPEAAAEPAGSG